ncbi:MAG TPA: S8 family serine peptidase [Thermoanaerobaculia bacterium]|nr:S8 family serine peptidase [Thermoanaerobaculia bacterium]
MRKLFAMVIIACLLPALSFADSTSFRSMQSGWFSGSTPLFAHGILGQRQIIAILDTGLDWDSCYFAEANGARPPMNTGSPSGGLSSSNVDTSRRKVIAYDFLYSCDQFPGAFGCDDPNDPTAFDNALHGTLAAGVAAGDSHAYLQADDEADGIAPGAKLIVQDGGYIGGDNCSQRPGFGCPVNLTPILDQAYKQGARIHSNSWGDRQSTPPSLPAPTANYSAAARDVDAFVWSHPDMLLVFDTGNQANNSPPPASSVPAPGCAKNGIQVGGTRYTGIHPWDDVVTPFSYIGPTRDGRIKPDLVAPSYVVSAGSDGNVTTGNCNTSPQSGTSWSAPSVAGAAALVRQYFTDGFYPTGVTTPANAFVPSAALLKAMLIAAARSVPNDWTYNVGLTPAKPAPTFEQGFGFPVLDDAIYFPGDQARVRVADVPLAEGLTQGDTATLQLHVAAGTPLKVALVWTDPAGIPRSVSDSTPELVNDLDLRVTDSTGTTLLGNDSLHPGQPDRLNNVEVVSMATPPAGLYTISVNASHLGSGPRQSYALVITGDLTDAIPPIANVSARTRSARH